MRIFTACILFLIAHSTYAFDFHWELDETPEGVESATIVAPITVILIDEAVEVPSHSASLALMRKYSVHLTPDWTPAHAYRLLQTFESIPQEINNLYYEERRVEPSVWQLTDRYIQNDITVEYGNGQRLVTIVTDVFVNATPLLAEVDGVRGRYFSKRLHRAVVRFVSDDGADRRALEKILEQRYAVSVNVPDYTELTKHTTGEHAGHFDDFKNEELMALVSMLEEFPTGMIKTPGLKYLARRIDGTPNPKYPTLAAIAWTGAGYIEFMEVAFRDASLADIHRIILHEKAHFLWGYLFDAQLKADWIEIGGWFENPNDKDGWSTTKQVEFVSAYAHLKNPNEDMAESISHYIVNPDKLRSRSPAKYEFIQNRIMHGTRYVSKIREDLTFQVYNLYPDYVYPGRIVRLDVNVEGEPEADKQVHIEIELYHESELDTAESAYTRIYSGKNSYIDMFFYPVDEKGQYISSGHILRNYPLTLSRYAADGYWVSDQISIRDMNGNERQSGQSDFGWQLYLDNPLADSDPPVYIPNSMRLSLADAITPEGRAYQVLTAEWQVYEKNDIEHVYISINDENTETYTRYGYGESEEHDAIRNQWTVRVHMDVGDYWQTGMHKVQHIGMRDIAQNLQQVFFSDYQGGLGDTVVQLDEPPTAIYIQTAHPDSTPPILDFNRITVSAVPTRPQDPDGETIVGITFRAKDDFSGVHFFSMFLRDPNGVKHHFWGDRTPGFYFQGDPTQYKKYEKTIVLPVGSIPGTWGLAELNIEDKAKNKLRADFTELVRFEVSDAPTFAKHDLNGDGNIDILDLVIVSQKIGHAGKGGDIDADINADGAVNILDLVIIANDF